VLKRAFPDSAITCRALQGDSILLTGYVTDNQTITQIMDVARVYSGNVINHIRVGGPQEVQLRVKILEVQRTKLRQFGVDFLAATQSAVIASSPGSIAPISGLIAPLGGGAPSATMTPSTANPASLAAGFSGDTFAFTMFLQALKTEGLLKVMTEPVLVARSGEAARLSDGGEFPIPVPGGLGTVTIEFREFGVILETLPIVISPTRVKQQVTAEVSDKDTANSITLLGTTVPGITKRRVQSTVDMNFGDTMVIAGLISTRVNGTYLKTTFLGELPLIGAMFSKKQLQESEIELIILITPEFGSSLPANQVPPGGPGSFTTSPTDREMYINGMIEVPKYNNGNCPPGMTSRGLYNGSPQGAEEPCSPVITPGPSVPQGGSGGLIAPPEAGPQTPIPPAPSSSSASRRMSNGSTFATKSRSANSTKSKDASGSTNYSPIEPAGFQNQQKPSRNSNGRYQVKKADDEE
jgi:pilus assembly protein CpaC